MRQFPSDLSVGWPVQKTLNQHWESQRTQHRSIALHLDPARGLEFVRFNVACSLAIQSNDIIDGVDGRDGWPREFCLGLAERLCRPLATEVSEYLIPLERYLESRQGHSRRSWRGYGPLTMHIHQRVSRTRRASIPCGEQRTAWASKNHNRCFFGRACR